MVDCNIAGVGLKLLWKKLQSILHNGNDLNTQLFGVCCFITSGIFEGSVTLPCAPKRGMFVVTRAAGLDAAHCRQS